MLKDDIKNKLLAVKEYLLKNYKIAFPVAIMLAVAVTVSIALGVSGERRVEDILPEESVSQETDTAEVPLAKNDDSAIRELILTFYNAQALGDLETIKSVCDEVSDLDLLSFQERANYIEYFPKIEIYTQKGMNEGETIVYVYYRMTFVNHEEEFPGYTSYYVCTADDGSLYIKRSNPSEELNEYTSMICAQDDVVEFNNRVEAEYTAFFEEHPELKGYPEEVMAQVNMNVGIKWSKLQEEAAAKESESEGGQADVSSGDAEGTGTEEGPVYASATTTVNVRSSDSEQADRLGKVEGGTRIQVLEQKVNGWSKVLYEGKEGYIKSEYLQVEKAATGTGESAEGQTATGKITANTNINVRASASEKADKLGVLAGGDTAELLAVEGDWSKIKYNGKVGYVKSEFVTKQ